MPDLTKVTLETVAGRRASGVFEHLFAKVLENIRDPNTDPEAVREISLKFKFKPQKSRNEAAVKLVPGMKLAPVEAVGGSLFIRHKKDGSDAFTHDPVQEELGFDEVEDGATLVDGRTGEVLPIRKPSAS